MQAGQACDGEAEESQSAQTTLGRTNPSHIPILLCSWIPACTSHGLCLNLVTSSATALPPRLTLPVLELQVLVVPMGLSCAIWRVWALQQLLGTLQVLLLTGQVQRGIAIAVLQPRVHSLADQCLDHARLLQVHSEVERGLERNQERGGCPAGPGVMSPTSPQ